MVFMNHYSSWCYSLNTLFIATLMLKLPTLFTIFVHALFIIRININLFVFSKFLPMNVRQWKSMSHAKYRTDTTMQLNNVMWLKVHNITQHIGSTSWDHISHEHDYLAKSRIPHLQGATTLCTMNFSTNNYILSQFLSQPLYLQRKHHFVAQ